MRELRNQNFSIGSVRSRQLLRFVHGQGRKSEQKPTTKKSLGFHIYSPILTMPLFTSLSG